MATWVMVWLLLAAVCISTIHGKYVGGYVLMSKSSKGTTVGLKELQALAASASSLPVTRVWVSFFDPQMVYKPGSNTLANTGLNVSAAGDCGFADVKAAVAKLQAGGVEVFLSLGGWNYNCFPYLYARYSVGGYGTSTPNYWKIQQYGSGDISNCNEANQYCYVCEPPSEGTTLDAFSMFPEPQNSTTWQAATQYVAAHAQGPAPQWNTDMVPGQAWTDTKTGITTKVPGSGMYVQMNRDPYQDFVYLAKDLGVTGIDLDYEEMWHADYFKLGSGPWTLPQTVYKYVAIAKDLILNINAIQPSLKLSTAAGAVGAWSGKWWGGNLKGVWYNAYKQYKDVIDFMATGNNAGGINVMTYDLSDNEKYHECPKEGVCSLSQQVQFYMSTYQQMGVTAATGYEVGTPAYPDPTHDQAHQLPLTTTELQNISQAEASYGGGFMWELFKAPASSDQASPTQVAQAICKTLMRGSSRCNGSIPDVSKRVVEQ